MSIAWSCVSRDGIILAEAGKDDSSGAVTRIAEKINKMKATAGWEKTRSFRGASFRALKFHVFDNYGVDDASNCDDIIVWTFCCVYHPKQLTEECAKAFLSKLVTMTEPLRRMDLWREGPVLSAQQSFAPTLLQQMENAKADSLLLLLTQQVDETKAIMQSNIEHILNRGEKLEDLEEKAKNLSLMSQVFKKKSRKVRRMQQWQNAKYGVVVGTAVTGAVGVVVIPPLVAFL